MTFTVRKDGTISTTLYNDDKHDHLSSPGQPKCIISFDQLEFLREQCFIVTEISKMFGVSHQTLHTNCEEMGFNITRKYTDISDSELDELIKSINLEHHLCGERILYGTLKIKHVHITRQ